MIKDSVALAVLLALALVIPVTLASTPGELGERIHALVEAGNIETALAEGVDAVTQYPEDPGLLHEVGRAAFRGDRYHLAIYYFKRALLFRPNYSASLLYLGWAQKRADLSTEARQTFHQVRTNDTVSQPVRKAAVATLKQLGPEPPLIAPRNLRDTPTPGFFVAAPYMALLEYGDATPKFSGETYQLDLRAGMLGRGYVEFSEAWTSVQTLPDYPDYEVLEHRIGLAGFVSPKLLLKGKHAFVDSDYDDGGDGHFSAVGIDWLRPGHLRGGLTASVADYPDGRIAQVTPRITWHAEQFELTTALDVQQWEPTDGDDEVLALIRQNLLMPLPAGDGISVGYAAGESRYSHAGFGDVLYTLPDRQTASAYLRYTRPIYPFLLSLKASVDTFKTEDGNTYHSTAHTLSLGYLSHNARATAARGSSPWSLALGASHRRISGAFAMEPSELLVTDVIDPLTFSDESGEYTSVYAYGLESVIDTRQIEAAEGIVSPWVELRRTHTRPNAPFGIQFYGRYTFVPYAAVFAKHTDGYQSVVEGYETFYNGESIGGGRGIFATYDVAQSGRFDLNLHELALGIDATRRMGRQFRAALGGGLLMGLGNWTSSRTSEWTESGSTEVLAWDETFGSGQELLVGATADLRLRWEPANDSAWFIEAGAGFVWYDDLEINTSPIAADLELSSFNGMIGIGLR
jgi:hypothetical protein